MVDVVSSVLTGLRVAIGLYQWGASRIGEAAIVEGELTDRLDRLIPLVWDLQKLCEDPEVGRAVHVSARHFIANLNSLLHFVVDAAAMEKESAAFRLFAADRLEGWREQVRRLDDNIRDMTLAVTISTRVAIAILLKKEEPAFRTMFEWDISKLQCPYEFIEFLKDSAEKALRSGKMGEGSFNSFESKFLENLTDVQVEEAVGNAKQLLNLYLQLKKILQEAKAEPVMILKRHKLKACYRVNGCVQIRWLRVQKGSLEFVKNSEAASFWICNVPDHVPDHVPDLKKTWRGVQWTCEENGKTLAKLIFEKGGFKKASVPYVTVIDGIESLNSESGSRVTVHPLAGGMGKRFRYYGGKFVVSKNRFIDGWIYLSVATPEGKVGQVIDDKAKVVTFDVKKAYDGEKLRRLGFADFLKTFGNIFDSGHVDKVVDLATAAAESSDDKGKEEDSTK